MTTDAVGGVWQYSTDLAETLAAHGYRTTLALLGPPPSPAQQEQAARIPEGELIVTGLPLDWLSDSARHVERAGSELAALARQIGADLVHCNSPACIGAAVWPVPVVAAAHGCVATWWDAVRRTPLEPSFHWHRDMVRDGLLKADAVIAPSRSFATNLRDTYALRSTPLPVLNGRRRSQVHISRKPAMTALTVGRMWDEAKNGAVLDRAAGLARTPIQAAGPLRGPHGEDFVPAHLVSLGEVGEQEMTRLVSERPVFVSAATFEPFGLAVLEAAQAGCALVLSDIATFRELWDGAAVFVDPHDAAAYAEAVDRLVDHPAEREELGRRAAARALRYTPEACAAATAAVYDAVLAEQEVAA